MHYGGEGGGNHVDAQSPDLNYTQFIQLETCAAATRVICAEGFPDHINTLREL